jgi:hypothetical protein
LRPANRLARTTAGEKFSRLQFFRRHNLEFDVIAALDSGFTHQWRTAVWRHLRSFPRELSTVTPEGIAAERTFTRAASADRIAGSVALRRSVALRIAR